MQMCTEVKLKCNFYLAIIQCTVIQCRFVVYQWIVWRYCRCVLHHMCICSLKEVFVTCWDLVTFSSSPLFPLLIVSLLAAGSSLIFNVHIRVVSILSSISQQESKCISYQTVCLKRLLPIFLYQE